MRGGARAHGSLRPGTCVLQRGCSLVAVLAQWVFSVLQCWCSVVAASWSVGVVFVHVDVVCCSVLVQLWCSVLQCVSVLMQCCCSVVAVCCSQCW